MVTADERIRVLERNEAVRDAALKAIDSRLNKIETGISRVMWLVITLIVGAAVGFILNGGRHVPGA